MAVNKIMEIAVTTREGSQRETLRRLAATAMSSKLIHRNANFFTTSESWIRNIDGKGIALTGCVVVVDAVLSLDQDDLNEKLIGIKKITEEDYKTRYSSMV